tara:strand:+ start:239189 stop:240355 length:1167 start_codon:yes stop_codon:yes gene_type:complete
MTTDNKKNKDEKIDLGEDAVDAVADFVTDPKQRNKVWQTLRWGFDAAKKLFTMGVYIATNVATAVKKAAPVVLAALVGIGNVSAKLTRNWRNNLKNNWSELDEFGNTRSCKPKTVKGWWQTVSFPAAAGLTIVAAVGAYNAPEVKVADYRDDPIYLMLKPQIKDVGGEKEWTVACEFLNKDKRSETENNCGFSIPDNTYLDITYRIKEPGWTSLMNGYSPRYHAAAPMMKEINQYCAVNSYFHEPVFSAEKGLPPLFRAPICEDKLDALKDKLSKTGEVYEDDGNWFYKADDQPWWITGAAANVFSSIGNGIGSLTDSTIEFFDEITTPEPEPEPEEKEVTPTQGVEGEKTSSVDFNNATNGIISNDNQGVTYTASISFDNGPKVKVA